MSEDRETVEVEFSHQQSRLDGSRAAAIAETYKDVLDAVVAGDYRL